MLSCTEISFVTSFFNFEKFWVKPGLPFTKLNRAYTQNLEKFNFDMFYKNACWAVICYPICVTNVSYERKIIVLPSLLLVLWSLFSFLRYLILNLGFLFIDSHCTFSTFPAQTFLVSYSLNFHVFCWGDVFFLIYKLHAVSISWTREICNLK